jgi:hypothetical protein
VSCSHSNPAGYQFCGSCGEALNPVHCRCGFSAAANDIFCGRCGASLLELANGNAQDAVADHRFNLEHLAQQAAQEKQFLESTDKVRVTQDDIRKLLASRRKNF